MVDDRSMDTGLADLGVIPVGRSSAAIRAVPLISPATKDGRLGRASGQTCLRRSVTSRTQSCS